VSAARRARGTGRQQAERDSAEQRALRATRGQLDADACEMLVRAGTLFVGIDSLNIDDTADGSRPAHTMLLGAGIPICEHMTNLAAVPSLGGRLHAAPIAWAGGASFPVRAYVIT